VELTSVVVAMTIVRPDPPDGAEHKHLSQEDVRALLESVPFDGVLEVGSVAVSHVGHVGTTHQGTHLALEKRLAQQLGKQTAPQLEGATPLMFARKGQEEDAPFDMGALMKALAEKKKDSDD
jgi:hypothetical protein